MGSRRLTVEAAEHVLATCRSGVSEGYYYDGNLLSQERFWREFDPLLKEAIEDIKENPLLDKSQWHLILLNKYFNINLENADAPITITHFPHAYFSSPKDDSLDNLLHKAFLYPQRLYTNHGVRETMPPTWHRYDAPNNDMSPFFRTIIQLYLLSDLLDDTSDADSPYASELITQNQEKIKALHQQIKDSIAVRYREYCRNSYSFYSNPVPVHLTLPTFNREENIEFAQQATLSLTDEQLAHYQGLASRLGKLNQGINLSPARKAIIRACIQVLQEPGLATLEKLNEAQTKANDLLANNFTAPEANILLRLLSSPSALPASINMQQVFGNTIYASGPSQVPIHLYAKEASHNGHPKIPRFLRYALYFTYAHLNLPIIQMLFGQFKSICQRLAASLTGFITEKPKDFKSLSREIKWFLPAILMVLLSPLLVTLPVVLGLTNIPFSLFRTVFTYTPLRSEEVTRLTAAFEILKDIALSLNMLYIASGAFALLIAALPAGLLSFAASTSALTWIFPSFVNNPAAVLFGSMLTMSVGSYLSLAFVGAFIHQVCPARLRTGIRDLTNTVTGFGQKVINRIKRFYKTPSIGHTLPTPDLNKEKAALRMNGPQGDYQPSWLLLKAIYDNKLEHDIGLTPEMQHKCDEILKLQPRT